MPKILDLKGMHFGRLKAISLSPFKGHGVKPVRHWICQCTCGCITITAGKSLVHGNTKSCGCLARETSQFQVKHNKSHTREYLCWLAMKKRCSGIDERYDTYIINGIKVCDEWVNDFSKFFNDMGVAPSSRHSLERIDNEKGYYKKNCRWATSAEQNRNYSQNRLLTYNNKTLCVTEWAERLGIARHLIYHRLDKGWSVEKTLSTPKLS